MKASLFILALALIVSLQSEAQIQSLGTLEEVHAQADSSVQLMIAGNYDRAFSRLKPFWPLSPYQIDGLKQTTATQFPMLEETFGKMVGYEFIKSESVGSFGHAEHFLIKYEKNALRLYMIYYNNGKGWMVNSLQWDDRWDLYFDIRTKE